MCKMNWVLIIHLSWEVLIAWLFPLYCKWLAWHMRGTREWYVLSRAYESYTSCRKFTNMCRLIASCVSCQCKDKMSTNAPAPLTPVELPDGPWEKEAIDVRVVLSLPHGTAIIPPLSQTIRVSGLKWHLSLLSLQKWLFAFQLVFGRELNPPCLVSDNRCQFTSHAFASSLRVGEIEHLLSSVYYLRANGTIETFNRVLKDCIQPTERRHKPWKQAVTRFLQNYHATPHANISHLICFAEMCTKLNVIPVTHKTVCKWKRLWDTSNGGASIQMER